MFAKQNPHVFLRIYEQPLQLLPRLLRQHLPRLVCIVNTTNDREWCYVAFALAELVRWVAISDARQETHAAADDDDDDTYPVHTC